MNRSSLKYFSLFREVRGDFSASWTQYYSKLPEMDRSSLKYFPHLGGGAHLPAKPKVTQNCLKWIDPVWKFFPVWGGGIFLLSDCWWNVQWCMEYGLVKLLYIMQYEPSISPKGRKEEGRAFRPIWTNLRFRRSFNIGLSFIRKTNKVLKNSRKESILQTTGNLFSQPTRIGTIQYVEHVLGHIKVWRLTF